MKILALRARIFIQISSSLFPGSFPRGWRHSRLWYPKVFLDRVEAQPFMVTHTGGVVHLPVLAGCPDPHIGGGVAGLFWSSPTGRWGGNSFHYDVLVCMFSSTTL